MIQECLHYLVVLSLCHFMSAEAKSSQYVGDEDPTEASTSLRPTVEKLFPLPAVFMFPFQRNPSLFILPFKCRL